MKLKSSFPRQVFVALAVVGGLGVYPLLKFGSDEMIRAVIAGAVIATVNVLLGYAAIEYSFGKSTTTFFKYVLGGMGIRMLGLALVLVLLIRMFDFHAGGLVVSMGVLYVVYLVLEVLFIQKKISIKHRN